MIDSHCHLNFESLYKDFDNIISRAKKNDIKCILSINTDPKDFDDHYKLIRDYQSIYLTFGIHPDTVNAQNILNSEEIYNFTKFEKVIGIGETGLDFYHSTENKSDQYKSFEYHIESSYKSGLPLIIHQRNSENEIIEFLNNFQKFKPLKVIFHCFTGTEKLIKFCLDNEFYISLSGIITFKNAEILRNTVKSFPLDYLLVETDSPFLSPSPLRGKNNEPSFIKHTYDYLSEFYEISKEEFIKITDDNFYKLFSKSIRYNEISK